MKPDLILAVPHVHPESQLSWAIVPRDRVRPLRGAIQKLRHIIAAHALLRAATPFDGIHWGTPDTAAQLGVMFADVCVYPDGTFGLRTTTRRGGLQQTYPLPIDAFFRDAAGDRFAFAQPGAGEAADAALEALAGRRIGVHRHVA